MRSKRGMLPFFAVAILFNMATGFAHPVTPTLFKELGMPDYMFGYALAALTAVNFLFSPFWGRLNSYLSSRISLLIACLGYALGQYFFASVTTGTGFILARMFAGLFSGGAFVSTMNYAINMAPDGETRGVWLAATATIQSVAGAFGFFVGGMLGSIKVSYALTAQYVTLAACGLLFLLVCRNDTEVNIRAINPRQLARDANPFRAFLDCRQFMTRMLLPLFVLCALQSLGQIAFDQSFNYYLKDQFNFSSAYNGALKAAMGIVTLIANSTVCIYLIRRTDKKKSLIGLFALCSVTMLIIVNLTSVVPFLAVNVLFYAFSAICLPLLQDVTADHARDGNSNAIMAFFNTMKSLGSIFGALAAGTLYAMNPTFPFICSLAAFGIGTAVAWHFYTISKLSRS